MSNTLSKFQEALAARNAQKAEETARRSGSGRESYPEIPWSALQLNSEKVIRLVGLPYSVKSRSPTDSKRIFLTRILGDDDRQFRCIGPDPKVNKDFILHRVRSLVMAGTWDSEEENPLNGTKGTRVYSHAKSHPDIFNRVAKNNRMDNPYEKGWQFSPAVLFNVIDRHAMDWHKENRKLRLLSKKAGAPDSNGIVWFDVGVPDTVYGTIVDDLLSTDGNMDWETYDIVIKKLDDRPWYKCFHGIDDSKRISEESRKLVLNQNLTDEERSWEPWDLDKLFPITSYKKIKSSLGIFLQQVDRVFGKHYYEELQTLVEVEENNRAETLRDQERGVVKESFTPKPKETLTRTFAPREPASEPAEEKEVKTRMTPEKWAGLIDGTLNGQVYKGVSKMTEGEKAMVIDVNQDGTFEWDARAGQQYEGATSGFNSPECIHVDPFDGTVFPSSSVAPLPTR